MTSGMDIAIDNLKTGLNEIKSRLTEYRRLGLDTKIAELKAMNIPYKIKLAEATLSYKDIERVSMIINNVNEELDEAKGKGNEDFGKGAEKEIADYRSNVEKKDKGVAYNYSESEVMKTTERLINEAKDNIGKGDYYGALHNYIEMREIYKYLPKELKKPIYMSIMEIYREVLKSGIIQPKENIPEEPNRKVNIFKKIFSLTATDNK